MSFTQLNLSTEILRAIADQGYTEPTPIQTQAIPPILDHRDIMGAAQTGTGKTAGFTLPMLHLLQPHANSSTSPARHPVRALILVPTRELAMQVYESVQAYGKYVPLKYTAVFGGVDMDPQIRELRAGAEILVATPGRLLDHIQQKTVNLSRIEILILDEADRMLDMGFLPDIKRILSLLPENRQSLLFSATFSEEIKKLANKLLKDPISIEVAKRNSITELITHVVHLVPHSQKRELLAHLVKSENLKQVLVFVRTKHGASRLAQQLEREGIAATAIHGDKTQAQRTEALARFKQSAVRVLVATDVAARGLDIEDLPHVFNYELPASPEDYIHRIGRTGRAGMKGNAVSLVSEDEAELLENIEKLLKIKLIKKTVAGFELIAPGQKPLERTNRQVGHEGEGAEQRKRAGAADSRKNGGGKKERRHVPAGRSKIAEDPLFSQPYTPSISKNQPDPDGTSPAYKHPDHLQYGHKEQATAALFMPRPPRKPQPDGEA